jgi:hypothetical protein
LRERRDETIAVPCRVDDLPGVARSVTQRLAQARYMEPKAPLLDGGVGPNFRQQVPFADGLAWARRQGNQNVGGACAQFDRLTILRKHPFARSQPELAE